MYAYWHSTLRPRPVFEKELMMPLREANELAQATWYKRLVKLDLSGCEGSLMGLKPLGNVVTTDLLRISSCRKVDPCTGPEKLMRSCPALECCLNDKEGM
ncbi:hypothetical protein Bca52824_044943 [Brassica carinata]|uniref:Uncharacterized protein n=1 Tax=Brassica carinata TaxID=52824 RepID=A0A8X7RHB3_BRACI|nr:hypothetical protein Bca52824_044943 [Brassica carinata]